MISRRSIRLIIMLLACILLCSCSRDGFKGFYEEELSEYLTLGEYKGLSLSSNEVSVSEEELESEIEKALYSLSELVETDKAASDGSCVKLDRYCFIGGESVPELSASSKSYYIGKESGDAAVDLLLPLIIGMKKGETAELTVTLPEGYAENIKKETKATYRVTVLSVSELVTPELNDETAKILLPSCSGAEEYRAELKKKLENEKLEVEKYRQKSEAWKKLVDLSTVTELPYDVYAAYSEEIFFSYKQLAEVESMELKEYLEEFYGMSEAEFDEMVKEKALNLTKEALVLYSLVKKEGITFTEEELSAYASECARLSDGAFSSGDEYLDYYGKEKVSEELLKDKAEELLLSYAAE